MLFTSHSSHDEYVATVLEHTSISGVAIVQMGNILPLGRLVSLTLVIPYLLLPILTVFCLARAWLANSLSCDVHPSHGVAVPWSVGTCMVSPTVLT